MAILVSNIALPVDAPREEAFAAAFQKLRLGKNSGAKAYVAKTSVDARRQQAIKFVYTVGVHCPDEERVYARAKGPGITLRQAYRLELPVGETPLEHRPVVVGFGPAGMFAALLLARQGYAPLVLERGGDVDSRVAAVEGFWAGGLLDLSTNVQFGEGGAGTFSDGKLTTRINDPRCEFALTEFVRHGAPADILEKAKPHIGTDYLRGVVKSIRQEIQSLGGEVRFNTPLTGLRIRSGRVVGVCTPQGEVPTGTVVLAIGHSARDTFRAVAEAGVELCSKPFSVGVRIEHLQTEIDRGLYGQLAGHPSLPVGEYQLSHRRDGRGVYTFCMCPGGFVVPAASEEGMVVTNGMSEYRRDRANANSAVVVSVDERDFGPGWQAGVAFQQQLERAAFQAGGRNYKAPAQTVGRLLSGQGGMETGRVHPSYARGVEEGDFSTIFPPQVTDMLREGLADFGRKLPGFDAPDALLTGVETRTSSPVRIPRGEDLQAAAAQGLYPCGEGAGYAGGIMSAAVDGIRVAQAIIEQHCPPAARP